MTKQPTILVPAADVAARIDVITAEMAARLDEDAVLVGLLQGAFIFMADVIRGLARHGAVPATDFLWLSSYGDGRESGRLNVVADLQKSVAGRQVVIVDDVYDTGRTLQFAIKHLEAKGAREVMTCLLARKPLADGLEDPTWCGFSLGDRFLVGYGLDDAGKMRGLPDICALD
jgi:hypoxanthine phosphoribosyltransferase